MCKESAARAAIAAAQEHCTLCPRRCGAARREAAGLCGMGAEPKVARAALHYWEEPCISGRDGSGTVFFLRLYAAVRILPESGDQHRGLWPDHHRGTPARSISGAGGCRGQ